MAHHFLLGISRINARLENHDLLTGNARAFQPANKFLGFAREHGTTNHLYSAGAVDFPHEIVNHECKGKQYNLKEPLKNCKDFVETLSH